MSASFLTTGKTIIETIKIGKEFFHWKRVKLESVMVDTINSSWRPIDNTPNTFVNEGGNQSPFPILYFSFTNNTQKTVLLTAIELKAKHLNSGLAGIPKPRILKSAIKYKVPLPSKNETTYVNVEEIEFSNGQALKFQVELYNQGMEHERYAIHGRKVLYFKFKFGVDVSVTAPKIFLNCSSENDKMEIWLST